MSDDYNIDIVWNIEIQLSCHFSPSNHLITYSYLFIFSIPARKRSMWDHQIFHPRFNGNFRILKWRYRTIYGHIFGGYSLTWPLYGRYLQFRFLKWPLKDSLDCSLTILHRENLHARFQGLEATRHSGDGGCTGCTGGRLAWNGVSWNGLVDDRGSKPVSRHLSF